MLDATRGLLAMVVVIGTTFAVPVPAMSAADDSHIEKMIQTAKTAADHEAIAAEYDRLASEATAKAAEHKAMAARYRHAIGPGSKSGFAEHCDGLVVIYNGAAKEYRALAAMHRAQAKSAR
jgi:hypothetical protein